MSTADFEQLAAAVRRQVQSDRDAIVDFTSALIHIASENPPGVRYRECADLIASHMKALGFAVEEHNPTGNGPCVAATFGSGGRALYFSGHYDVVPAQDASLFAPEQRKGNLHGRGAADMKGGIAAMAYAMRALAAVGFRPNGRVISMSVPDEETSGPNGTVALVKAGIVERDAIGMLTAEPTSGVVWNANRGVISVRVTIRGTPAHVGLHFRGVNAFRAMLRVAARFEALDRETSERLTTYNVEPEAARRSVLLMGGELSGGHNFNVVPDVVSFTIDRRTNPEEDFDAERRRLFQVIDESRAENIDCDLEVFQEGVSASSDANGEVGRALAASIADVTGEAVRFEICPGVLETRHYASLGIPAFAYGAGLLSVSHGPHEFVSIDKLVECAEVYALAAARLLG